MDGKYEKRCGLCDNNVTWYCENCKGLGYVPTEEGDELLTFLKRNGFVQAREPR